MSVIKGNDTSIYPSGCVLALPDACRVDLAHIGSLGKSRDLGKGKYCLGLREFSQPWLGLFEHLCGVEAPAQKRSQPLRLPHRLSSALSYQKLVSSSSGMGRPPSAICSSESGQTTECVVGSRRSSTSPRFSVRANSTDSRSQIGATGS